MRKQRGMTLIEVVVWITLFTLVMFAVLSSVLYFYRTNSYTIQQSTVVTSAQHGIDKMVRTIREASYSSQGAFPVVSIGPNELIFYADVDADPLIEKVHYYLSGTTLVEGVVDPSGDPPVYTGAEATSSLAEYVHNLDQGLSVFRYYDKNGAEITNYAQWAGVRFVNVDLLVNVDLNKLPAQLTMSSSAALRNLVGK